MITLQAHRCVLVASLEYFRSMLASGWVEASTSEALKIPIASLSSFHSLVFPLQEHPTCVFVPGDVMSAVVDFLYSDESEAVERSENVEFVMNVLVVADQLLMPRLQDVCETSVAAHRKHALRMF